jgi:hypothetical protein
MMPLAGDRASGLTGPAPIQLAVPQYVDASVTFFSETDPNWSRPVASRQCADPQQTPAMS